MRRALYLTTTTLFLLSSSLANTAAATTKVYGDELSNGWRISCIEDQIEASKQCILANHNAGTPFRIVVDFTSYRPIWRLTLGRGYDPTRPNVVRIDNNEPYKGTNSCPVIGELINGNIVRFRVNDWPYETKDYSFKVHDFKSVFDEFERVIRYQNPFKDIEPSVCIKDSAGSQGLISDSAGNIIAN